MMNEELNEKEFCLVPFETLFIENDKVALCCPPFLPGVSLGSISNQEIGELWNSQIAQDIRSTILTGSYSYCSPVCTQKKMIKYMDLSPKYKRIVDEQLTYMNHNPKMVYADFDYSCNLTCRMCRDTPIYCTNREDIDCICDKLINYNWAGTEVLSTNGSGEVFASRYIMRFLESITEENFPDLKEVLFQTNGLLFNEINWKRIEFLANKYRFRVWVSVDAANEDTYSKIRIGGNYHVLMDNLKMISGLKKDGRIDEFVIRFCIQKINWREMVDFTEIGKKLNVDMIQWQILRGGMYGDNVHIDGHPEHAEFMEMLKNPVFNEERFSLEMVLKVIEAANHGVI